MPSIFGNKWAKMPFLEIAVVVGMFALGRNFNKILSFLKNRARAADLKFHAPNLSQNKELVLDIRFRKLVQNPTIHIEIYELITNSQNCFYQRIKKIKKVVPSSFNPNVEHRIILLDKTNDILSNRDKSALQLIFRVFITSSSGMTIEENFDVYLPHGPHTNYIENYRKEWALNAQIKGDSPVFVEIDEVALNLTVPFEIKDLSLLSSTSHDQ